MSNIKKCLFPKIHILTPVVCEMNNAVDIATWRTELIKLKRTCLKLMTEVSVNEQDINTQIDNAEHELRMKAKYLVCACQRKLCIAYVEQQRAILRLLNFRRCVVQYRFNVLKQHSNSLSQAKLTQIINEKKTTYVTIFNKYLKLTNPRKKVLKSLLKKIKIHPLNGYHTPIYDGLLAQQFIYLFWDYRSSYFIELFQLYQRTLTSQQIITFLQNIRNDIISDYHLKFTGCCDVIDILLQRSMFPRLYLNTTPSEFNYQLYYGHTRQLLLQTKYKIQLDQYQPLILKCEELNFMTTPIDIFFLIDDIVSSIPSLNNTLIDGDQLLYHVTWVLVHSNLYSVGTIIDILNNYSSFLKAKGKMAYSATVFDSSIRLILSYKGE
ncbi:VPS9 domain-containing protein [Entamoeba marina]